MNIRRGLNYLSIAVIFACLGALTGMIWTAENARPMPLSGYSSVGICAR